MNLKHKPYFIIVIVGLLLYVWTAFFDFTYLDDQSLIIESQRVIGSFKNIGQIFTDDAFFSNHSFYYRPLLNISLMLDAQVAGAEIWFYHITNVLLHILGASLLFTLLMRLGANSKRSLFLALFFLIHPTLVQAVAWVPGRNDILLAVFILATFLTFINFLEKKRIRDYVFSLLFFCLSIFTKEAAIVIPVLIGFYYLFLQTKKINVNDKLMFIFGTGAIIFLWFILRRLAVDGSLGGLSQMINSVLENSAALIIGFGKFFLPFNLAIMPVMRDVNIFYGVSAVIFFSLLTLTKSLDKKWVAFGLIWFILFMLPSFVNPNPTDFYYLLLLEHRLYLPFIGLILIFSKFNWSLTLNKDEKLVERVSSYLGLLIIVLFIVLSAFRLPIFKDRITFWEFAVKKSPDSPLANRNLGAMYYFEGRTLEARERYLKALELNPFEAMAHNNIGVIYLDEGLYDEAEKEFLKELEVNPGYEKAIYNLERLYILKNQVR